MSSASTRHKGRGSLIYTKYSSSDAIRSVSFLPNNRFLLSTTRAGDLSKDAILKGFGNCPVLVMYDLDQASASQHQGISSPIALFSVNPTDPRDIVLPHHVKRDFDPGEMRLLFNIHAYSDEVAV